MSNSSPSLQPVEQEQISELVPAFEVSPSMNQETPNQPDPEIIPPSRHNLDSEYNCPEEEEEGEEIEDGQEQENPAISSGMSLHIDPPITDPHVLVSDVTLTSPSGDSSTRRGVTKRKKGKGKGKSSVKKQQAIEKNIQTLMKNLKPIPFIPTKILDFANHEKLLKKLGLWDFVHIDFDRSIRIDLIAQLVANYNPKLRASYVNNCRVMVNRADLARAFKLPLKKERGNVGGVEGDLDCEVLSEDSIGFVVDFLSEWVLLHEDMWMMPNEVRDWLKLMKDGRPEKVDWAGLLWFMVEKELKQGGLLRDCYYASHLQHLIKVQREELILKEVPDVEELGVDAEVLVAEELGVDGEVLVAEELGVDGEVLVAEELGVDGEVLVAEGLGVDGGVLVAEGLGVEGGVPVAEELGVDAEVPVAEELGVVGEGPVDGELGVVGEGPVDGELGVDGEANEEEDDVNVENVNVVGSIAFPREEDPIAEGPSTELKLGQDGEKEEGLKDVEMMDAEKSKDSDEEGGGEEQGGGEERGQWLLNGKNDLGEHILQRCGVENTDEFDSFEYRKDEEEEMDGDEDEEEAGNGFHVFTNDHTLEGDGFGGNLLQAVEGSRMDFSSQDQLRNPTSMDVSADMQHIASPPSFFNNSGKRVLEHDNHISHHSIDDNKRLRINDPWDNKPLDFGMCLEQIQQITERAKMLLAEKEQAAVQSNMNQQILLSELQKRDAVIEHLHKTRLEETQKKDREFYRLERELCIMGGVLDGYRKALKDVQKSFAEYREKANLAEEPTYKDTGEGGLMLTAPELEKLRRTREEEYKMKCLVLEQKMKEAEEDFNGRFSGHLEKINLLDKRLTGLEADAKELISLYAKRKLPPTEETGAEVLEPLPSPEPEEKVPAVPESPQISEPEAQSPGAAEPLPFPKTDEEAPEDAEPPLNE